MNRISKAIMRALGGRPNGTDHTSCVDDSQHVRQIIGLLSIAFTAGALLMGYKGLPARMTSVEKEMVSVRDDIKHNLDITKSMDSRMIRIESILMEQHNGNKSN